MRQFFAPLLEGAREAVAPARCMVCLTTSTWLCLPCWQQVAGAYPSLLPCILCGERATSRGLICPLCRPHTPLMGVISAGSYQVPYLQRAVRWLKFKGIQPVAEALAHILLPRLLLLGSLPQLQEQAVFIPIPLHPKRWRERGFNQSELLATHLSQMTRIPIMHMLERTRTTWTQSHLPLELRQENMRDSFSLSSLVSPTPSRTLAILVDDVTTTGATLTAAAKAIAPLTFRQMWGLTVARG